ncbi:hypothetical protein GGX14DRAFT_407947 [Mycena pura]|uniref:Uncharacterized protein n=1 Tax=Mycena pura TaxID=153505 RepID=A0AAD6UMN3_9AGAR|nr:hypothetical protein GGX14DRAFT_407947 [Mycena pura]
MLQFSFAATALLSRKNTAAGLTSISEMCRSSSSPHMCRRSKCVRAATDHGCPAAVASEKRRAATCSQRAAVNGRRIAVADVAGGAAGDRLEWRAAKRRKQESEGGGRRVCQTARADEGSEKQEAVGVWRQQLEAVGNEPREVGRMAAAAAELAPTGVCVGQHDAYAGGTRWGTRDRRQADATTPFPACGLGPPVAVDGTLHQPETEVYAVSRSTAALVAPQYAHLAAFWHRHASPFVFFAWRQREGGTECHPLPLTRAGQRTRGRVDGREVERSAVMTSGAPLTSAISGLRTRGGGWEGGQAACATCGSAPRRWTLEGYASLRTHHASPASSACARNASIAHHSRCFSHRAPPVTPCLRRARLAAAECACFSVLAARCQQPRRPPPAECCLALCPLAARPKPTVYQWLVPPPAGCLTPLRATRAGPAARRALLNCSTPLPGARCSCALTSPAASRKPLASMRTHSPHAPTSSKADAPRFTSVCKVKLNKGCRRWSSGDEIDDNSNGVEIPEATIRISTRQGGVGIREKNIG